METMKSLLDLTSISIVVSLLLLIASGLGYMTYAITKEFIKEVLKCNTP